MFQAIGAVTLAATALFGGIALAGMAIGIALVGWGLSNEYA